MVALTCVDCGSTVETDLVEFDDLPIGEWWASKGERCARCRRAASRGRSRRAARGHRTAGRGDSATRGGGSPSGLPTAGTRRRAVYDVLLAAGDLGLTVGQLAEVLNRPAQQVVPRVRALVRDGLVQQAGFQRAASSGARQDVWRVRAQDRAGVGDE